MRQFLPSLFCTGNIAFRKIKHPISIGAILITQTILICLITSNIAPNAWFSYILFLVFLGGLLVLFIYITRVASNELFQKDSIVSNMLYIILAINLILILLNDPFLLTNIRENNFNFNTDNLGKYLVSGLFNPPYNFITMAAVLYLFLTPVVVIKITEHLQGPLRCKN